MLFMTEFYHPVLRTDALGVEKGMSTSILHIISKVIFEHVTPKDDLS